MPTNQNCTNFSQIKHSERDKTHLTVHFPYPWLGEDNTQKVFQVKQITASKKLKTQIKCPRFCYELGPKQDKLQAQF